MPFCAGTFGIDWCRATVLYLHAISAGFEIDFIEQFGRSFYHNVGTAGISDDNNTGIAE